MKPKIIGRDFIEKKSDKYTQKNSAGSDVTVTLGDSRDSVRYRQTTTTSQRAADETRKSGKTRESIASGQSNGMGNEVGEMTSETRGGVAGFIHRTLGPLFIMLFMPNLVIVLWYTARHCEGSFQTLFDRLTEESRGGSVLHGLSNVWQDIHIASPFAVTVLVAYMLWALFLMVVVPGPRAEGPVTPNGHTPVYKDNGFSCFLITMAAFSALACYLKTYTEYSVTVVYDHFDEFLGTLTTYSYVLCAFLYVKGHYFPSTADCGTSGNPLFDYYRGMELYPRIFGIDIKVFTNCRFGMTVWPLLVSIFTLKNYELYGFVDGAWVSFALYMVYCAKFFWWESGYMRTIDIMMDRAGFTICWGCMAFIPGFYASVSMYFAEHARHVGTGFSLAILAIGVASCLVNYLADEQKLKVRRTNGECSIWGRRPEVIVASHSVGTSGEKEQTSLLVASGYWGIARHFHYVPELTLALMWALPAQANHLMPYSYFIFLFLLLVHRTYRDDEKCRAKYGEAWEEYCRRVPYKMIPYVF